MKLPIILPLHQRRQKPVKHVARLAPNFIVVGVVVRNVVDGEADEGFVIGTAPDAADVEIFVGDFDEVYDDVKGWHADGDVEVGYGFDEGVFGGGVGVGVGRVVDEPVGHDCGGVL